LDDNKGESDNQEDENALRSFWAVVLYVLGSLAGLAVLITVLTVASYWLNTAISDRVQFVTGNLLNALIFAAIVSQVLIYRKQRDIMKQQQEAMQDGLTRTDRVIEKMQLQLEAIDKQEAHLLTQAKAAATAAEMATGQLVAMQHQEQAQIEQAKTMDRQLVLGTRAYLGIQSVSLDIASKRVFLHVENVGKVPAKDILVVTEIKAEVPETKYRAFCSQQPQIREWSKKGDVRYLQIPFLNQYGRTKLFPGSLRMPVMFRLDTCPYFSDQQFSLVTGGYAKFTIRGIITYWDGFHSGKKTEFAFRYFAKNVLLGA
jgi:hypothetical protein